jgi:transposase
MNELASGTLGKYINLTDGEARLMRNRQGIIPAYNAQAVVLPAAVNGEVVGLLMTGAEVFTNPDDHEQLIPMLEQAEDATGAKAGLTLADAGYYSGTNLEACDQARLLAVIPENRPKAAERPYHKDCFSYDEADDSYTCPLHGGQKDRCASLPGLGRSLPRLSRLRCVYQEPDPGPRPGSGTPRHGLAESSEMDVD